MQQLFGSELHDFVFIFRDYIRAKYGVELEVRDVTLPLGNVPGKAVFLSEDHPHFAEIMQEKDDFLSAPFDEKYRAASWQMGEINNEIKLNRSLFTQHSKDDASQILYRHKEKFTLFLTALCVLIYIAMWLGLSEPIIDALHFPADTSERDQFWRYLTHTLVHLSTLHILFNLTWWWIFGGAIERKCGMRKLFTIYFIAGLFSGIAQFSVSGSWFFGLSGVVYAVLGYVFVLDKFSPTSQFNLPSGFFSMLVVGIALGFAGPFIGISVGNTGHITGLLIGMILAWFDVKLSIRS